jgi:hypothetical protein
MRHGIALMGIGLLLAGCSSLRLEPSPSIQIPTGFAFVVDRNGTFEAVALDRANDPLRQIAERTGVFGLVDTGAGPPNPSDARIAAVTELGGTWLWARCADASDCTIEEPSAWAADLDDVMGRVARAPEPAPGENVPPASAGLTAWLEYVGAVAFEFNPTPTPGAAGGYGY